MSQSNDLNNAFVNLEKNLMTDPISKIESYDAIIIESKRLLKREQSLFFINSIVTISLIITLFNVI